MTSPIQAHPVKLLLVEDCEFMARGLRDLVSGVDWIRWVGECNDGAVALQRVPESGADTVLLDLSLPTMDGFTLTAALLKVNRLLRIIWLCDEPALELITPARLAGVRGIAQKNCSSGELIEIIQFVAAGKERFSPSRFHEHLRAEGERLERLSNRQKEVLMLIAGGFQIKQVADLLEISPRTVETHRNEICERLNLRGIVDMTRYAVKHRLVT